MSIDWDEIKQNIIDRLDIVDAYAELGLHLNRTGKSEWLRAINDDAFAVNIRSGGFKDHRNTDSKGSFWTYAMDHGSFDSFRDCLNHYAEKTGIELPTKPDPAKDLEWLDDLDDSTLTKYCKLKRISVDIAKREGAKVAKYKKETIVVSFPIYAEYFGIEPCGYVIVRPDGKKIGKTTKLLTRGSYSGIIGKYAYQRLQEQRIADRPQTAIKCEGLTDFLRMSTEIPDEATDTTFAFSNASGCSESPADWVRIALFGATVLVVGDADRPGQAGAQKWAGLLAHRSTVKTVKLPYAVTETKGKDLCDYFQDGHTFDDFLKLPCFDVEPMEEEEAYVRPEPFRNYLEWFNDETDKNEKRPKKNEDIVSDLLKRTDGWPKVCQGTLFFEDGGKVIQSPNVDHFFFRLQKMLGMVDWVSGSAYVTKRELFQGLHNCVDQFDAIETLPHVPSLPGVYYVGCSLTYGDGSTLEKLLDFFSVADQEIDRELLRAAFMSPLWGGPPGTRPAFFFTSKDGPGAGKTKTAEAIGYLFGGAISMEKTSSISEIKTRILSDKAQGKRIALLDNIQAANWRWGDFEALLSARAISGKVLYVGEGTRPNYLTYLLTGNGLSLGRDISERVVEIRMQKPDYFKHRNWVADLFTYIDQNRMAILADLAALLTADPQDMGNEASRWSDWEVAVLSKCANPQKLFAEIQKRQSEADSDEDTSYNLHEVIWQQLDSFNYNPVKARVFIPSWVINDWYRIATKTAVSVTKSTRELKMAVTQGTLPNLAYHPAKDIRGFVWEGDEGDNTQPILRDLAGRVTARNDARRYRN